MQHAIRDIDLSKVVADARAALPECQCPRDDDDGRRVSSCPYCAPALAIELLDEQLQEARRRLAKHRRYKHHELRFEMRTVDAWRECGTEPTNRTTALRMARQRRGWPDYRNVRVVAIYRKARQNEAG